MDDTRHIKITGEFTYTFPGDPPGRYLDLKPSDGPAGDGVVTVKADIAKAAIDAQKAEPATAPTKAGKGEGQA